MLRSKAIEASFSFFIISLTLVRVTIIKGTVSREKNWVKKQFSIALEQVSSKTIQIGARVEAKYQ